MKLSLPAWFSLLIASSLPETVAPSTLEPSNQVFVKGAKLVGGTNGILFDDDNNLYACQSLGRAITKLNPQTGEILEVLTEGKATPDDAVFTSNGTLFWSEPILGTLGKKNPGMESELVFAPGSYPMANPLVLSDDDRFLYFGQCFNDESPNGIYRYDIESGETITIIDGIPHCSSNSMDYKDGVLYTPRLFEGRVVKIDLKNNNTVSNVSTGLGIPNAVKFNSKGELYGTDSEFGKVYRYDINDNNTETNRELVFQTPFKAIDNLMFDANGDLYLSSVNRGSILQVTPGSLNEFRTVSPGILALPSGCAVLDNIVYTVNPNGVYGYDSTTAEEVVFFEPVIGTGVIEFPFTVVAWESKRLLLQGSLLNNQLVLWNPDTETTELKVAFAAPMSDVHPFQGDSVLAVLDSGDIVMANGTDYENQVTIATIPGALFLAGDENSNVYVSNIISGSIQQIINNGHVLDTPIVVSSGHDAPEGIEVCGENCLLVVASGSGQLEKVDISTGEVTVVACDLNFQPPLEGLLPFGFPNDVAFDNNFAYVNGDGSNVIYKFDLRDQDDETTSNAANHFAMFVAAVLLGIVL